MTLRVTGNAVVFTGITLAIGVFTWVFSPLQFQADMGILLTFMFLVNMFGAILLLPALAAWLLPAKYQHERAPEE
jgi:predicted RND superfamily exporter protein